MADFRPELWENYSEEEYKDDIPNYVEWGDNGGWRLKKGSLIH